MTLNDFEPPKIGGFSDVLRFRAATHISRANCAEMNRPKQPANHHQINLMSFVYANFKKGYPLKSGYFTVIGCPVVKTVAYRIRHAACHKKHWQ